MIAEKANFSVMQFNNALTLTCVKNDRFTVSSSKAVTNSYGSFFS